MPKSTLGDAHGRVDPGVLLPVMRELAAKLPGDLRLDRDVSL